MLRAQWRSMTPEARLELTCSLVDDLETLVLDGIRALHPDWTDDQVRFELTRRRYGRGFTNRVFAATTPAS